MSYHIKNLKTFVIKQQLKMFVISIQKLVVVELQMKKSAVERHLKVEWWMYIILPPLSPFHLKTCCFGFCLLWCPSFYSTVPILAVYSSLRCILMVYLSFKNQINFKYYNHCTKNFSIPKSAWSHILFTWMNNSMVNKEKQQSSGSLS